MMPQQVFIVLWVQRGQDRHVWDQVDWRGPRRVVRTGKSLPATFRLVFPGLAISLLEPLTHGRTCSHTPLHALRLAAGLLSSICQCYSWANGAAGAASDDLSLHQTPYSLALFVNEMNKYMNEGVKIKEKHQGEGKQLVTRGVGGGVTVFTIYLKIYVHIRQWCLSEALF